MTMVTERCDMKGKPRNRAQSFHRQAFPRAEQFGTNAPELEPILPEIFELHSVTPVAIITVKVDQRLVIPEKAAGRTSGTQR
jgi:hypothetical protein